MQLALPSGQNEHTVPVTSMADCLAIDAFATRNVLA